MAVSADAVFAAVAAWGLAALAVAATRDAAAARSPGRCSPGCCSACCVMLSYGLPLLGFLALAVLSLARSWRPLPLAARRGARRGAGFAAAGFAWWEAYPVLARPLLGRPGRASGPAAYWIWGNLAALVCRAGPMLGAGLGRLAVAARPRRTGVVGAARRRRPPRSSSPPTCPG